jgi:hypothetical protein
VNDLETTITLKRVELGHDDLHDFCFDIKVGTSVAFALTVPVFAEHNAEPNQMWLSAYIALSNILNDAAKVAMELARQQHAWAAEEQKRLTPEERLLRSIFDRPRDPDG